MKPFYERNGITIYCADNRDVLPLLEPVASVVTDPPYGLSFMGKGWDHQVPGVEFWQAISAAMLPGAHMLTFGGTRTFHRMGVAIEDAGFEMRDTLQWLYGSGFPKSHDVSKAIDKMAGAEREVVGQYDSFRPNKHADTKYNGNLHTNGTITAPATPEAERWQGWGTALKPAYEPIIMARLPFRGTVAQNVLQHGTGAINIDASRIPSDGSHMVKGTVTKRTTVSGDERTGKSLGMYGAGASFTPTNHDGGRWPANVILDEEAAAMLDAQSGVSKSGTAVGGKGNAASIYGTPLAKGIAENHGYGDTGGASRYFKVVEQDDLPINQPGASRMAYHAKASRRERNAGLDGMPERLSGSYEFRNRESGKGQFDGPTNTLKANHHPTVKPLALMRYLIQMVTPPGGVVLDPFMGSGSTLVAAAQLGFPAIGIEMNEEYAAIAARRVEYALESQRQLALAAD